MSSRVSIVIVDDSALFRVWIRDVLREIPGTSVIGNADSGETAIEKIISLKPDLVTLDVEMPGMNGLQVLQELQKRGIGTAVIMVSRLTEAGAQITTQALLDGAFDFILKPAGADPAENRRHLKTELTEKIEAVLASRQSAAPGRTASAIPRSAGSKSLEALIIGTSTGGPDALRQLLPLFPASFPVPICVVQHMPAQYTKSLAARLDALCSLQVLEAEEGMVVRPGVVLIAPGGKHLQLVRNDSRTVAVHLNEDPPEQGSRPSVDVLFRSAAEVYRGRCLGLIMTGMGRDGTAGGRILKEHGGRVLVQAPEGCTVFGMPKAAWEAGIADACLPLTQLAGEILREFKLTPRG